MLNQKSRVNWVTVGQPTVFNDDSNETNVVEDAKDREKRMTYFIHCWDCIGMQNYHSTHEKDSKQLQKRWFVREAIDCLVFFAFWQLYFLR